VSLLPMWPIWLAVAVILVTGTVYCVICAGAQSHRPTRNVGVTYCDDCAVPCTGAYPCWCCRESGRVEPTREEQ